MSNYIMDLRAIVGHRPLLQVGASVIVEDEKGRILLQLRSDNHCWGYAGGAVELDEVVEEAAKRELLEETGLIANKLEFFGIFSGPDTHYVYPNGDEVSNVDIVFLCKDYSGALKCQAGEVDQLQFFFAHELPQNISPPIQRALQKWASLRQSPLVFRKLERGDAAEITAFKEEFQAHGSSMDGTGVLFKTTAEEWLEYIQALERRDDPKAVPCLQYGLFQKGRLLGMIQVRLQLKGYLIDFGGHIGYCMRPSQRRKGYAKEMLGKALDICREEGLKRVLLTCLEDNIGSAKTIEAQGGVFEKTVYDDVNYKANMKRYWISLS